MNRVVLEPSRHALVSAVEANLVEHFSLFGRLPGAEVYDGPDMMWLATPFPRPVPNGVYRTSFNRDRIDRRVADTLEVFRSRSIKTVHWISSPSTRPTDLGTYLEKQGFSHTRDWVGMVIDLPTADLEAPSPVEVSVEEILDMPGLGKWLQVFRSSSNFPEAGAAFVNLFASVGFGRQFPLRHYVGSLHGEPVGRTTLAFAAGVAGIHWVATAPQARRKGVASALVLAALKGARESGYRFAVLHSTEAAVEVYRHVGFEEVCLLNVYEWRLGGDHGA